MTHFVQLGDASDRIMAALTAGLAIEFGHRSAEGLARHFLDAEEIDFHWDSRGSERWLGTYESQDDEEIELDRVAICGRLDGKWFAAICIIDGDGNAHGMTGCRTFGSKSEAQKAYTNAR